jgi:hypothetical protein
MRILFFMAAGKDTGNSEILFDAHPWQKEMQMTKG